MHYTSLAFIVGLLKPQNRTNRSNCDKSMKLSRIEAKVFKIRFHSGATPWLGETPNLGKILNGGF